MAKLTQSERVLIALSKMGSARPIQLAEQIGIRQSNTQTYLQRLAGSDYVKKTGEYGVWEITSKGREKATEYGAQRSLSANDVFKELPSVSSSQQKSKSSFEKLATAIAEVVRDEGPTETHRIINRVIEMLKIN